MARVKGTLWTPDEAGKEMGVAGMTVARWLKGERYPMPQMMKKIERAIGWKATEQIDLVRAEGMDLAYAIGLRRALNRYWGEV